MKWWRSLQGHTHEPNNKQTNNKNENKTPVKTKRRNKRTTPYVAYITAIVDTQCHWPWEKRVIHMVCGMASEGWMTSLKRAVGTQQDTARNQTHTMTNTTRLRVHTMWALMGNTMAMYLQHRHDHTYSLVMKQASKQACKSSNPTIEQAIIKEKQSINLIWLIDCFKSSKP